MKEETELFFDSIMREDRSVMDLLNADYTFVNERLARHYGMPEHLRQPVPPRAGPERGAPRPARTGQHPDRDVVSESHVAGRTRQVDSDEPARRAAAAAAAEHPAAAGQRRGRQGAVAARADGEASRRSGVRRLPPRDGSDRVRDGELRRHRPLAREGRRRGRSTPSGTLFTGATARRRRRHCAARSRSAPMSSSASSRRRC